MKYKLRKKSLITHKNTLEKLISLKTEFLFLRPKAM